jgi:hypothetical protein
MAAKFGDDGAVASGDAYIINAGSPAARDFARGRDQPIAKLARLDKSDVALCGDNTFVMRIAGKGEGRIRQRKDEAAVGDPLAIDHVRLDRHRQRGMAGLDLDNLHAKPPAGIVLLPHRLRTSARDVIGRRRGLVHGGLPVVIGLAKNKLL